MWTKRRSSQNFLAVRYGLGSFASSKASHQIAIDVRSKWTIGWIRGRDASTDVNANVIKVRQWTLRLCDVHIGEKR